MTDTRRKIILDYARWTALSTLRSGAPVKSRAEVYPLLDAVEFRSLLCSDTPISRHEFDGWHQEQTDRLCHQNRSLKVGWAVKLLNVYLKTAAYVGDLGRPGLRDALHPPIDGGLWLGLDTLARTNSARVPAYVLTALLAHRGPIKGIEEYTTYRKIIEAGREVAGAAGCLLVELEQFWLGSATPPAPDPDEG